MFTCYLHVFNTILAHSVPDNYMYGCVMNTPTNNLNMYNFSRNLINIINTFSIHTLLFLYIHYYKRQFLTYLLAISMQQKFLKNDRSVLYQKLCIITNLTSYQIRPSVCFSTLVHTLLPGVSGSNPQAYYR